MVQDQSAISEIRAAIEEALRSSNYLATYKTHLESTPIGFLQTHLPVLGPYLIACAAEDQKRLAQEVLDESQTMKKLTWAVLVLTSVVAVLTAAVVVLTWFLVAAGK